VNNLLLLQANKQQPWPQKTIRAAYQ